MYHCSSNLKCRKCEMERYFYSFLGTILWGGFLGDWLFSGRAFLGVAIFAPIFYGSYIYLRCREQSAKV